LTLRCTEIAAGKGGRAVFTDWTVEVNRGQTTCLVGVNGVGKTTFLEAIMGTAKTYSGSVSIDDKKIAKRSAPSRRARLGITLVPEGRGVIPGLTVFENLALGAKPGTSRARVKELAKPILEMWPILVPLLARKGGQLSGGERQALAIARGLMRQPRYLLLDEPTLGLAPVAVARLREGLAQMTDDMGILIAEQNLSFAADVATNVVVVTPSGNLRRDLSADERLRVYLGDTSDETGDHHEH
jgi:ABC-type branched-subunit amino acid transport system ATPase component